jgi:hypothetical protein
MGKYCGDYGVAAGGAYHWTILVKLTLRGEESF